MTDKKRKKNTRLRGTKTHGWGAMKKHRGAGHRGGRGNASSGKRSDARKPSVWKTNKGGKDPRKKGFNSWLRIENRTINIGHLNSIAEMLVRQGHALEAQGSFVINLREMGYTKLLGAGTITKKLKIGVAICTPSAKEKIEAAGGSVDADVIADREGVIATREQKAKDLRASKAPKKSAAPEAKKADKKAEPAAEE